MAFHPLAPVRVWQSHLRYQILWHSYLFYKSGKQAHMLKLLVWNLSSSTSVRSLSPTRQLFSSLVEDKCFISSHVKDTTLGCRGAAVRGSGMRSSGAYRFEGRNGTRGPWRVRLPSTGEGQNFLERLSCLKHSTTVPQQRRKHQQSAFKIEGFHTYKRKDI